MKKTNYHTHTKRCMHACGSDEEYVLAALQNGYETLGFSDHTPWNYKTDFVAHMRMRLDQAQGYLDSVAALKEKYQGKIEILCGFECEYFPGYMDWLLDYLIEHDVDYIIFGHHYYRTDENRDQGDRIYFGGIRDHASLQLYVEDAVSAMKTGMYSYFCHPELFMRGIKCVDETVREAYYTLCRCAKECGMPLEYNLAGAAYNHSMHQEAYPHHAFWEVAAEVGNTAIIGVDAHDPRALMSDDLREEGLRFLRSLGMTITDELPRVDFRALRETKDRKNMR